MCGLLFVVFLMAKALLDSLQIKRFIQGCKFDCFNFLFYIKSFIFYKSLLAFSKRTYF